MYILEETKTKSNRQLVQGKGINDADFKVIYKDKVTNKQYLHPIYRIWNNMLSRCYNTNVQQSRSPTYEGSSVCEEWLTFSTFMAWVEKQDHVGMALDKDIINEGNTVYSPENCIFVTQHLNNLFTQNSTRNVTHLKKKDVFVAAISIDGITNTIGQYKTEAEAQSAYAAAKYAVVVSQANRLNDKHVTNAIIKAAQTKFLGEK